MKKRLWILLICMAAVIAAAGCNLGEKIGEKVVEGVLDKAAGDDVDIDFDGGEMTFRSEDGEITFDEDGYSYEGEDGTAKFDEDGYTFEGEDGSTYQMGGNYEWPEDKAGGQLPVFDGGMIASVLNSDTTCLVTLTEVEKDAFEDYLDMVKDKGFTDESYEASAEDWYSYSGTSGEATITIYYYISDQQLTLGMELAEN